MSSANNMQNRSTTKNPQIHGWKQQVYLPTFKGISAESKQEINTRKLQKSREGTEVTNGKCWYCHNVEEGIFHILCACPSLSASLYLPTRHDVVAKHLYNAIIKIHDPSSKCITPPPCYRTSDIELWWDTKIAVTPSVPKNKPDKIIDVCVPFDINVATQEREKRDKYMLLSVGLKRLYPPEYEFQIVPIVRCYWLRPKHITQII